MAKFMAEYIWIDGTKPSPMLRSKTKILNQAVSNVQEIPEWGFDGSSTMQAETGSSDCQLKPVALSLWPKACSGHLHSGWVFHFI